MILASGGGGQRLISAATFGLFGMSESLSFLVSVRRASTDPSVRKKVGLYLSVDSRDHAPGYKYTLESSGA